MARMSNIGFGPRNIIKSLILSIAVYLITLSPSFGLAFLGFHLVYTLLGQLLGFERRE
jgi:hypothetical protein